MREFLPSILTWACFSEPEDDVLQELVKEGVAQILIANSNHVRAANTVGERTGIVGDIVIGKPPGPLWLLRERVMDDPAQLRASVRRLLELDFEAVLVGDGVSIREGAREHLRELVEEFPPG